MNYLLGPPARSLLRAVGSTRIASSTTALRCLFSSKVVKKKKKSSSDGSQEQGRSRDLDLILRALDAPTTKPPADLPPDDILRDIEGIRRRYTIGRFQQHNREQHDLAVKLKLKRHAIKMLPPELKEAALAVSDDGPPRWRHMPAWTPPIAGFDPNKFSSSGGEN